MNTRMIAAGALVLVAALAAPIAILSQDVKPGEAPAGPSPEEQAKMMELWMKMAMPGEQHALLAESVGKWTTKTSIVMGPGEPTVTEGTSEITSVLGGRFVMESFSGTMMGMPWEGIGMTGYDNFKKKYVMTWADTSGTSLMRAEGLADQTGKIITCYGTMDEFLTGEHDKTVKYVLRIVSADQRIFEVHDLAIGEPNTKVVEVQYKRAK